MLKFEKCDFDGVYEDNEESSASIELCIVFTVIC